MGNYLLSLDGIQGESKEVQGAIQVDGYQWSQSISVSGGNPEHRTVGKPDRADFAFTMPVNKASPFLFHACATADPIKTATLSCRKAIGKKQQEYLKWTLSDVLVVSYNTSGGGEGPVVESFSLSFTKVEMEYKPEGDGGTLGSPVKKIFDYTKQSEG